MIASLQYKTKLFTTINWQHQAIAQLISHKYRESVPEKKWIMFRACTRIQHHTNTGAIRLLFIVSLILFFCSLVRFVVAVFCPFCLLNLLAVVVVVVVFDSFSVTLTFMFWRARADANRVKFYVFELLWPTFDFMIDCSMAFFNPTVSADNDELCAIWRLIYRKMRSRQKMTQTK